MAIVSSIYAQGQAMYAPKRPTVIVEMNPAHLFTQMRIDSFNQYKIAKEILRSCLLISANSEFYSLESMPKIQDIGINLNEKIYNYYVYADSVDYQLFTYPIADTKLFEKYLITSTGDIMGTPFLSGKLYKMDNRTLAYLAGNQAVLIKAKESYSFFYDQDKMARYGITVPQDDDPAVEAEIATDSVVVDSVVEAPSVVEIPEDDEAVAVTDSTYEDEEEAEDSVEVVPDESSEAELLYKQQKDSLIIAWSKAFLKDIVDSKHTIQHEFQALKGYQPQAKDEFVTVYLTNAGALYANMSSSLSGFFVRSLLRNNSLMEENQQEEWTSIALKMERKQASILCKQHFSDKNRKRLKRIYDHSINKRFLKYLNTDNDLMVIGLASNTRNLLEEMPNYYLDLYRKILPNKYGKSFALLADFINVAIDEKALSKLVVGDALFVMNGVEEKLKEHINYEWDSTSGNVIGDTTWVNKKYPSYMFMFSTENDQFFHKLLAYSADADWLKKEGNGIYAFTPKRRRADFIAGYLFVKDGIVFFVSNKKDAENIMSGNYVSNYTKEERRLLRNNNVAGWINSNKYSALFDEDGRKFEEVNPKAANFMHLLRSTHPIYMKSGMAKDNFFTTDVQMSVPDNYSGSATEYIIDLLKEVFAIF